MVYASRGGLFKGKVLTPIIARVYGPSKRPRGCTLESGYAAKRCHPVCLSNRVKLLQVNVDRRIYIHVHVDD